MIGLHDCLWMLGRADNGAQLTVRQPPHTVYLTTPAYWRQDTQAQSMPTY